MGDYKVQNVNMNMSGWGDVCYSKSKNNQMQLGDEGSWSHLKWSVRGRKCKLGTHQILKENKRGVPGRMVQDQNGDLESWGFQQVIQT